MHGGSDVKARLLGELLEDGETRSRKLGTLPWGAALTAVVELKIGAAAVADSLLAVNFEATTKDGSPQGFGPEILSLPELDLAAFSLLAPDVDVAAAISEAVVSEELDAIEALIRKGDFPAAKQRLEALSGKEGLTSWAQSKLTYLRDLLDEDVVMAMKEMRYASRNFTRGIRSAIVTENSANFSPELEAEKELYIRKKMAAGRRTGSRQTPRPPQA